MQATLNKSLNEFVESVKNDLVVKMPPDGTVHELTSNVMMMLERLLSFVDMVSSEYKIEYPHILFENVLSKTENNCFLFIRVEFNVTGYYWTILLVFFPS